MTQYLKLKVIQVNWKKSGFLLTFLAFQTLMFAQEKIKTPATFSWKNGIGIIAPDSLFSVNFRFRMQNRAAYNTVSEDNFNAASIEARVRRLRMRIDGFMYNPKLTYYVQLSFSRGDMDWISTDNSALNTSVNVVRDAVITYKPTKNFSFLFGQTKLPGNRQRVVSSGELQFADRSITNATFTIDRDFGFQAWYEGKINNFTVLLKSAITSGEGRNSSLSNSGLAYTGRLELLPFGKFTDRGDYFEGDLAREPKPKLALCGGINYNEAAVRSGGTLGRDLLETRNIATFITDFVFKYRGFALAGEWTARDTKKNPITTDGTQKATIYVGYGNHLQASYIFKNNYEIALRYASVTPYKRIMKTELKTENYTFGITKYIYKHRVKCQFNTVYETRTNLDLNSRKRNWSYIFQIELGI